MSNWDEEDQPVQFKEDLNKLKKIPTKEKNRRCSRKYRALAFTIGSIAVILVVVGVTVPTVLILTKKRMDTTSTSTIAATSANSISTTNLTSFTVGSSSTSSMFTNVTIMPSSLNLSTAPTTIISDITSMAVTGSVMASTLMATYQSIMLTTGTSSTTTVTVPTTTTTMVPPNLFINPGAENGTLSPWIIGGSGIPTVDDGTTNSGKSPRSGAKDFYGGYLSSGLSSTLTQSILLLNSTQGYTATQLDSGNLSAYINFYEQSLTQTFGTDEGGISLAFRTLSNTLVSTVTTSLYSCSSGWCGQSFSYSLPIGTRRIDYIMMFV